MPERSNGTVSKTVVWATVPRVRIPLFPPSPAEALAQAGFAFYWISPNCGWLRRTLSASSNEKFLRLLAINHAEALAQAGFTFHWISPNCGGLRRTPSASFNEKFLRLIAINYAEALAQAGFAFYWISPDCCGLRRTLSVGKFFTFCGVFVFLRFKNVSIFLKTIGRFTF